MFESQGLNVKFSYSLGSIKEKWINHILMVMDFLF